MDALYNNPPIQRVSHQLGDECLKHFLRFLHKFKAEDSMKYVEIAKKIKELDKTSITVSFRDIMNFDEKLSDHIMLSFYRIYPYLNNAAKNFIVDICPDYTHDISCSFIDMPLLTKLRQLRCENLGKLVRVRGQVIRSNAVHPELILGTFKCLECSNIIKDVEQEFIFTEPPVCPNAQCNNRKSFKLLIENSKYVDFQKLLIQETQDELPRGVLPRSLEIIVRGDLVERAYPGDLSEFIGTLIQVPDISQFTTMGSKTLEKKSHPPTEGYDSGITGLKSLGVRTLAYKLCFMAVHVSNINNAFLDNKDNLEDGGSDGIVSLKKRMSPDELATVYSMSRDPRLVTNLCDSLFPNIYGNEEVKKGILLMLFGGVAKETEEGTKLRGDINVCIVGEPSTGKSQFLTKVEQFSDRSVYTSGKASSAAGLTAAVVRDTESGEYVIEAGALMLANNGICCIDEFDKMELKDQVAIHEAMEQQTISIAKAGVKATLSARCSILAAANPIFGRYDRSRSLRQNINLTSPLLSRFDLFFVLLDECNEDADQEIGNRLLEDTNMDEKVSTKYSDSELRRYIAFARCFEPVISEEAAARFEREFKLLRQRETTSGTGRRITVRQLESLVRLSEALARLRFSDFVSESHVGEAVQLMSQSFVRVTTPDVVLDGGEMNGEEDKEIGDADAADQGTTMTYDEYRAMCNRLLIKVRECENSSESTVLRRSELIEWYLEGEIDVIADETDYFRRKTQLELVIKRMVGPDHMLLEINRMELDGEELDDPIISLHPNMPLNE